MVVRSVVEVDEGCFSHSSVNCVVLLQDKRSVESCCLCFSRLVDSFASNKVSPKGWGRCR